MKAIKGILKLYYYDTKPSFLIFWGILSLFVGLFLLLAIVYSDEVRIDINAAAYIYLLVTGFVMVNKVYPYAIAYGATRKDYYIATTIFIVSIVTLFALMVNMLSWLLNALVRLIGEHIGITYFMVNMHEQYVDNSQWLYIFGLDILIGLTLISTSYFLATAKYRYGLKLVFAIILLPLLTLFTPVGRQLIRQMYDFYMDGPTTMLFTGSALLFIISLLIGGWLLMRKATVQSMH